MFPTYRKDERTDHERYLEDQLEDERAARQREDERRERERRQREDNLRQEWDYEYRQAASWPEALQKQVVLCRNEVSEGGDESVDYFFTNTVAACEKALELWKEVTTSKQPEMDELERQMDDLRFRIRLEVAEKLAASDPRKEFARLAEEIHADQLEGFLDW